MFRLCQKLRTHMGNLLYIGSLRTGFLQTHVDGIA